MSMTMLSGQTALITGGAKRLGRAVGENLRDAGVRLALHYRRSADEAQQFVETCRGAGLDAAAFQADLSNADEVSGLFARVVEHFETVDILINNASIFPADGLDEVSLESIMTSVQVNALAPLGLCRAFAAQGRVGSIVNLLDARMVDYDAEHVSYHLSKRMLFSLTRMMALEFAPLVRVNAVAPGLVLPPVDKDEAYLRSLAHTNPLQRHGSADDVVRAVRFLLESDFVTGQVIYVDGGRHMKGSVYG